MLLSTFTLFGLLAAAAAVDQTLEQGAYGSDVVDATINKILRADIFPPDFDLLRRLAWIETRDGTANGTFPPDYYGGIWRVSDTYLYRTKEPSLKEYHDLIKQRFNITWATLPWESLTVPLHCALAARLYLAWIEEELKPVAPPQNLAGQADLWYEWYNTNDLIDDPTYFNNETLARESTSPTCTGKMDLIFAVMSTPDLDGTNFDAAKNLVTETIAKLSLSSLTGSRIGFIGYATNATPFVPLENGLNMADLTAAITAAAPPGGDQDNTFGAIISAVNAFNNVSVQRPGVPRVLTILTGSPADDVILRNESLSQARASGLSTVVAGFSPRINASELEELALGVKTNAFAFTGAFAMGAFRYRLKSTICQVAQTPALDGSVQDILGPGETRYYKFSNIPTAGITLFKSVLEGDVSSFFSYSEPTPSSAIYDGTLATKVTFIASRGATTTVYVAIRGSPNFPRNNVILEGITGPLPCSNTTSYF